MGKRDDGSLALASVWWGGVGSGCSGSGTEWEATGGGLVELRSMEKSGKVT